MNAKNTAISLGNICQQFTCIHDTGRKQSRFLEPVLYSEGLYDLEAQCYAWMVPNGSWGETNAGLIVGNKQSLLIDTFWDLRCTQEMLAAMSRIVVENPIKQVVNTHSDGDHFWGNQLFKDREIIASHATCHEMHHIKPSQLMMMRGAGKVLSLLPFPRTHAVGHWFYHMTSPYDFASVKLTPANTCFSRELVLNVGGREVRLLEVGPAHTSGDTIVHVPDADVVYSGDICFIDCTPVLWAGPTENWIHALDAIIALKPRVVIPGHGPMTNLLGMSPAQLNAVTLRACRHLKRRGIFYFRTNSRTRYTASGTRPNAWSPAPIAFIAILMVTAISHFRRRRFLISLDSRRWWRRNWSMRCPS
jgi:cyclase